MIKIEHGRILLVIDYADADIILKGLDEIIYSDRYSHDHKSVLRAFKLADYIEEKLNEVTSYEAE